MKTCLVTILIYSTLKMGTTWASVLPTTHLLKLHPDRLYPSHLYEYPLKSNEPSPSRHFPYHSSRENIAELDDHLSDQDRADIAYIQDVTRRKRSGSGDILGSLKSAIGHSIKSKLGAIADGSKHTVAHFSGGSSGHDPHYDHHYDVKHFDLWSLKKHIIFTLFQAAKAINGLVIAGKGHLLKGGGYLISGGGRIITAKGEVLKNWGKHIANTALLSPHKTHSSVVEYHPHPAHISTGYGLSHSSVPVHHHHHTVTGLLVGSGGNHHGSRPAIPHYGDYISSPSAPGPNYEDHPGHAPVGPSSFIPGKYFSTVTILPKEVKHQHAKPPDAHSGLIVLKKIPPPEHIHHHEHHHVHGDHDDHHTDHSLPPIHPPDHEHPSYHHDHEHSDIHSHGHDYHYEDTNHHQHEVPDFKPIAPSVFHNVLPSVGNILSSVFSASSVHHSPTSGDDIENYPSSPDSNSYGEQANYIVAQSSKHENKVPPSTSYGTSAGPSSQYKEYFNTKDKTIKTQATNFVTQIHTNAGPGYLLPTIPPTADQFKIEVVDPTDNTDPVTIQSHPQLYIGMNLPLNIHELQTKIKDFPPFPGAPPNNFITQYFPQHLNNQITPTINSAQLEDPRYVDSSLIDNLLSAGTKIVRKAPIQIQPSNGSTKMKRTPTIDIMRSVAFELGPNGPVKL